MLHEILPQTADRPDMQIDVLWGIAGLSPGLSHREQVLPYLGLLCELLPAAVDEGTQIRWREALCRFIGLAGDLIEPLAAVLLGEAFERARADVAVEGLTPFDGVSRYRGVYERFPSSSPGLLCLAAKSDVADVVWGLRFLEGGSRSEGRALSP
jgi:hypothetical protein